MDTGLRRDLLDAYSLDDGDQSSDSSDEVRTATTNPDLHYSDLSQEPLFSRRRLMTNLGVDSFHHSDEEDEDPPFDPRTFTPPPPTNEEDESRGIDEDSASEPELLCVSVEELLDEVLNSFSLFLAFVEASLVDGDHDLQLHFDFDLEMLYSREEWVDENNSDDKRDVN